MLREKRISSFVLRVFFVLFGLGEDDSEGNQVGSPLRATMVLTVN